MHALQKLVDRYDPEILPIERSDVRVRLSITGDGAWDAVLDPDGARLEKASPDRADAELQADPYLALSTALASP